MKRWRTKALLGCVLSGTSSFASASAGEAGFLLGAAAIPPPPPRPKTAANGASPSDRKDPAEEEISIEVTEHLADVRRRDPPGDFSAGADHVSVMLGETKENTNERNQSHFPPLQMPQRPPLFSDRASLVTPTSAEMGGSKSETGGSIVLPTDRTGDNNKASVSVVAGENENAVGVSANRSQKASAKPVIPPPPSQRVSYRAEPVQSGINPLKQQPPPPPSQQKVQPGPPPPRTAEQNREDRRNIQKLSSPDTSSYGASDEFQSSRVESEEQKPPPPPIAVTEKNMDDGKGIHTTPSIHDSFGIFDRFRNGLASSPGPDISHQQPMVPPGSTIEENPKPTRDVSDRAEGDHRRDTRPAITPKLGDRPYSTGVVGGPASSEEKESHSTSRETERPFTFEKEKESQSTSQESNEKSDICDSMLVEDEPNRQVTPVQNKPDPPGKSPPYPRDSQPPGVQRHDHRQQTGPIPRPEPAPDQAFKDARDSAAKRDENKPQVQWKRDAKQEGNPTPVLSQAQQPVTAYGQPREFKPQQKLAEKELHPPIQRPPRPQQEKAQLGQLQYVTQDGQKQQYQPYFHNRHPSQIPDRSAIGRPPQFIQQQRPPTLALNQEQGLNQEQRPQPEGVLPQQELPPHGGPPQQKLPVQVRLPQQTLPQQGRPLQQQRLPPYQAGPRQTRQLHEPRQAGRGQPPQLNQPPLQKILSKKPPAWKRFLRKVEGSLDTLADLEDVVAGQAKRLYTATVGSASSAIKVPRIGKENEKTDDGDDSDLEPEPSMPTVKLPDRRERPHISVPPVNQSGMNQESLLARHVTMPQQQERHQQQQSPGSSIRKGESNGVGVGKSNNRPVVANGGAAPTPGNNNRESQVSGYGPSSPYQPPPPLSNTPPKSDYRPAHAQPTAAKPVVKDSEHRRDVRALLGKNPEIKKVDRPVVRPPPPIGASEKQQPKPTRRPPMDEDELSWKEKLGRFIPPLPSLNMFKWRSNSFEYATTLDAWDAEDGEQGASRGFLGLWKGKKTSDLIKTGTVSAGKDTPPLTPMINDLMERCEHQGSRTLLKGFERRQCVFIGRQRAVFDLAGLFFLLCASREFANIHPMAVAHSATNVADALFGMAQKLVEGWFHYAVLGAFLSFLTNGLLLEQASQTLSKRIGNQVLKEAEYGALFLRLVLSASTKRSVVEDVQATSYAQSLAAVESARLRTFVLCLLGTLVLMTLSFIRPLLLAIGTTAADICSITEWRSRPIQWKSLLESICYLLIDLLRFVRSALKLEVQSMSRQPLRFTYDASLCLALLLVAHIPKWEMDRSVQALAQGDDGTSLESMLNQASKVSNLGVSSATRLQLLSKRSALDEILERWRMTTSIQGSGQLEKLPSGSLLHQISFGLMSGLFLSLPIFVYGWAGITGDRSQNENLVRWDSLREVGFVLAYTQVLFLSTIGRAVDASGAKKRIVRFQSDFVGAVKERTKQLTAPPANLQLQASISPAAGVIVRDLWAAHSTRRAWGVRGASFSCRSGEVTAVLGDDGTGKSRLLTTIAEEIMVPPKQAQTVARVRGSVSVGGLDVSKWDPNQLRKRVGILLNDVRTVADLSQALTGLTIEEILEPSDGLRTLESSHTLGSDAKACMILALKITGLYSTLLPRLPGKLSTVVTGNEEDLNPSPLRPHFTILSPAEWSKLLLARVLCQSIYDNENAAATHDRAENCMIGSLLLLDDAMVQFSETDEGRLIHELRSSAAATVLTSNRWASGRWADRIVVLQDGAVVETGTHSELLSRGPQQSLYAAKWHAMTSA